MKKTVPKTRETHLDAKNDQTMLEHRTQMEPKSHPRQTKIQDQNKPEKKEDLEDRLGTVLGRLGCRLGVKIVLSPSVALVFLKIDFLKKMRVQEAT